VTEKPDSGQGQVFSRHNLLAIYLPGLFMASTNGMLIPVMPLFARSFIDSYLLIGVVLAAKGVGNLLFDIPAGVLVRRYGHRPVLTLGAATIIASSLAVSQTHSVFLAIPCLAICGIGWALWSIARQTYVAEVIRTENRGRSIALLGGVGRIGVLVGPVIGGLVAGTFGLRAPFLLYAFLVLCGAVVMLIFSAPTRAAGTPATEPEVRLWSVLRDNIAILFRAGSGQLCAQLVRNARHVIIPLYATDVLGLDIESVGLIISLAAAADVLMVYPAGVIMDRFGRKFAYVPSFLIQAAGMALIPLTTGFFSLQLVALLIGFGNGLGAGTMMTLGADLAPSRSRGEFIGIWRFIGDGGSVGGPLIVGTVAEVLGLLAAPVALAGIGFAGAGILAALVPETLRGKPAPSST